MKILLIEDNEVLKVSLKRNLENEGYEVFGTATGEEGLDLMLDMNIDIVILDIGLPDMDGYEVCRIIRTENDIYGNPYIIMFTSRIDSQSIKSGFNTGADDYIKKPFNLEELIFKVNAVRRRKELSYSETLYYQNIEIRTREKEVLEDKTPVALTKKEYELLYLLVTNKGVVISKEDIYEKIWGGELNPNNKTIEVYIHKIKSKLGILKEKLTAIKGFGYKLI